MFASLLTLSLSAALSSGAAKPNIIWVMADDLGWGEVSAAEYLFLIITIHKVKQITFTLT